jgi:hypothetical protein
VGRSSQGGEGVRLVHFRGRITRDVAVALLLFAAVYLVVPRLAGVEHT